MKHLFLFLLLSPLLATASMNIDSLKNVWNDSNQSDTNRLKAIKKISWEGYLFKNPDSSYYFAQQQFDFAAEIGDIKEMSIALNTQGASFYLRGEHKEAIQHYTKSLKLREQMNDQKGVAGSLNNIGLIYREQGNNAKAIECYTRSLSIQEKIGDKKNTAISLNNIGSIYYQQKDYDAAIEYFSNSLDIQREINDEKGIANSLSNIGLIYHDKNELDKALDYYMKSLKLREELGNESDIASSITNIGLIYKGQKEYEKAIKFFKEGLAIRERLEDKKGIVSSLNNLGDYYVEQGAYFKAINFGTKGLALAKEMQTARQIQTAAETLWKSYKNTGQHEEALRMHELFIQTRDSINSEKNQNEIVRQHYKYNYEKQSVADSIKNIEKNKVKDAQLAAEIAKNKQQKQQTYLLFGGLGITLLFGGFIYNRFRISNKQKSIIQAQKEQVDLAYHELAIKTQETIDSITYAKRIQSAILPPDKKLKTHLNNSFVLYKPKDIVAGDFYWLEFKNDIVFFAVADCTGHGVPGAMVSVVCNNALNRSVREYNISEPGKILDVSRQIVLEEFSKSKDEVNDGMDIALCALKGNVLHYAGAYNPLWIIRADTGELEEIKADKQPISKFAKPMPFTTQTLTLNAGDMIYIFTDGYVDQFGGEKGKKFKPKAFRETLKSIHHLPVKEQKDILNEVFESYRGNCQQVDDICLMGIRF
ncbi:hypothetical protein CW751_02640 [Brumimicrobium salinarum]|uniref:PPM-type phosphatase domain-containing protein n=1 Tax=Brumimicrobium salinarum TaxID=2058658 RepID=A0A2I0R6N1_9FLAO|nr:tetratricopeptide repeat protein [Brumimicrobium salinarum]PKR82248.1 hypothetical protein CW751_02640 [Brumimicrobium salinarum]